MKDKLYTLCFKLQDLACREDGQDLVEYALTVALIAFAATAGMNSLANGISMAFSGISSTLGSYVG
jgi:pilus assembly protein Flp/PilA